MSSTINESELDQFSGAIPGTDITIATTAGHGAAHKTSASPGVAVSAGTGVSCSHHWKANQSLKCHWARPVCLLGNCLPKSPTLAPKLGS
jgi:hypothetical protein